MLQMFLMVFETEILDNLVHDMATDALAPHGVRPSATIAGSVQAQWAFYFNCMCCYDDAITWNHFPRHWPFVRGIHRSSVVDYPHKGSVKRAVMFSLMYAWRNGWTNSGVTGDLRRHDTCDVSVTIFVPNQSYEMIENANIFLDFLHNFIVTEG